MEIKKLIAVFFIISFVFAQELEIEEIGEDINEEEFIEEEILIEDRAGITPDSPFYFVDEVIEDINLAVKDGEEKAVYALDVSEEKVMEAKLMADKNKSAETEIALTRANNISKIIEQEVSPDLENKTNEKMELIRDVLGEMEAEIPKDWESIKELIDRQKTQAEKNKIAAKLAVKIGDLCERLAMEDYSLMEAEPRCNPDDAPEWLKEFIENEIKEREEEALEMIKEMLTTCIMDPRTCDCSKIPVRKHQLDCEKGTALAIKCEFEEDFEACNELDEMGPPEFENLPEFMRDILTTTAEELIKKKEKEMFDKFAPPECKEAGALDRESCEAVMEEKYGPPPDECMENGKFIGPKKCEVIMMEKHPPPPECIEDGEFIGRDECEELMIEKYDIPEECRGDDGHLLPEEECRAIMEEKGLGGEGPPSECMEDGRFIGREECEELMKEKYSKEGGLGPPPECEGLGREECEELMKEKFSKGPDITPPPECEGLSKEECMDIMQKKGFEEKEIKMGETIPSEREISKKEISGVDKDKPYQQLENINKYTISDPNKVTVIGENGAESIQKEEIEKIKDEALEKSQEEIKFPEEAKDLSNDIESLEKESKSLEEKADGEIELPSEEEAEEKAEESESTEIEEEQESEED